jgi:MFS family permease
MDPRELEDAESYLSEGHNSLSVLTTLGPKTLIDEVIYEKGAATIALTETGKSLDGESLDGQSHATSTGVLRGSLSLKETASTRTFVMIMFWAAIHSVAFDTVFMFIPYFADDAGLSAKEGALALYMTGISMLTGNLTLGHIADKFGHTRTLQMTMTSCMLCIVIWPFCTSSGSLIAIMSLYGYFAAGWPMFAAVLSANYEKVAPEHLSTMTGIAYSMYAIGSFLGPVAMGFLVDSFPFYVGAFFLAGFFLLGNMFLYCIPALPAVQVEAINKRYWYDPNRKPDGS